MKFEDHTPPPQYGQRRTPRRTIHVEAAPGGKLTQTGDSKLTIVIRKVDERVANPGLEYAIYLPGDDPNGEGSFSAEFFGSADDASSLIGNTVIADMSKRF
jgi:hypothetical protein